MTHWASQKQLHVQQQTKVILTSSCETGVAARDHALIIMQPCVTLMLWFSLLELMIASMSFELVQSNFRIKF